MIRKGKEIYSLKYDDAVNLYGSGMGIGDIARKLGLSYSCTYHWVKGLRKPVSGNPSDFAKFIDKNGPVSVLDIKEKFPKHNELFHICSRRAMRVKRAFMGRKYLEYSTWYYMEGQENLLSERVNMVISKVDDMKKSLKSALDSGI